MAMMLGLMRIRPMEANNPVASPVTAPTVLKRFQKIENTIAGRLAEAATAKASPTRNATFAVGPKRIAIRIATAGTTNVQSRATSTSAPGLQPASGRISPAQRSRANDVEALMVSP